MEAFYLGSDTFCWRAEAEPAARANALRAWLILNVGRRKMPYRLLIALLLSVALSGCADDSPAVPLARKEALRKILAPEFLATSVPPKKEEDFFWVLDAFDAGRRKNELVRSVEFTSGTEASIDFANGGMHGGGGATAKKKGGKWTIDQKFYFM